MRIVEVSSEIVPFSKSGGLADVVGALSPALVSRGHQVMTVSPWYGRMSGEFSPSDTGHRYRFFAQGQAQEARFLHLERDGVHHVFLDHPYYERRGLYGDQNGTFGDNHLRYALLARAAIEAPRVLPLLGGQPFGQEVLFHVHDWPAALVPVYLDAHYRPMHLYPRAATVLTLHNNMHQGRFPGSTFADLDLPPRLFSPAGVEWHGDVGFLKGGLLAADELTTVSPTHAREITTPELGFGLDPILRGREDRLHGILNGLDTDTWDPVTDPFLPANFHATDLSGKATCKAALQAELGLPVDGRIPLLASVGRLDPQKGVELLLESIPWIAQAGGQVIVLGSAAAAHRHYEDRLHALARVWPNNLRVQTTFDEGLAHRFSAAADLFVMPSQFEPCGLSQLIALRYGTVPVVRYTGGLADTVENYDPDRNTGTGWTFTPLSGWAFREALHWAMTTWRSHPQVFDQIRQRGMGQDLSWDRSSQAYERVFAKALARRRGN
ncbi:MAG: glycogen synthase [Deltaproteobacteria bacterium]|nr:glycogen synthase [Deltaproteobacteria bacterium]